MDNVEYSFENDTLILKMKSFKSVYLEEDKKVFEKLEQELKNKNCNSVIFDIRGNGGGTDEYFSFLSPFTKEDVLEKFAYVNSLTGEKVETEVVSIDGNKDAKDYDRYLLVDKEVFSSADGLARLCKNTGFATVVGEKTRGEGIGLPPFNLKIATANELEQSQYNVAGVNMQFSMEKPLENESYMTTPRCCLRCNQGKRGCFEFD